MSDQRPRVLLVEDNADDEQLTLRGLRSASHPPEIEVARDGSQALDLLGQMASSRLPDLVLLDLKLPKLNGIEVLRHIRKNDVTCAVPVVILTSSDEETDVINCYRAGANSYVCKPVDYAEFLSVVKNIRSYWLELTVRPQVVPHDSIHLA